MFEKVIKVLSKRNLIYFCCLFAGLLVLLSPFEVFAFAQPLVSKANNVKENLILIAKASVGIGIVVFLFSMIANRPMWKFCISLVVVGALLGAFSTVFGFVVG